MPLLTTFGASITFSPARQVREQVELLEDHADVLAQVAQVGLGAADLDAVDADASRPGRSPAR